MCELGIVLSEYDYSQDRCSSVMCWYGTLLSEYDYSLT